MDRLRQRGWSVHSTDDEAQQQHYDYDPQRPRADSQMTCDTEPSLSEAEKLHLLNSAFDDAHRDHGDGDRDHAAVAKGDLLPPTKRQKLEEGADVQLDDDNDDGDESDPNSENGSSTSHSDSRPTIQLTPKQQEQLDNAKNKLSKWAARLFDPNRPRGLVEPPKVIPLNDEFLSAFGKREKEYDVVAGRGIDIDQTSLDIIDVSDAEDDENNLHTSKKNGEAATIGKVKIANLSYATTTAAIARQCGLIGPVVDVNIILDDRGLSSGRAYVTFEDADTAASCVETMHEKQFEGRTLFVSLAAASSSSSKRKTNGESSSTKKQESRYWERDISTKCNSCGEVGHIARNCPNDEKPKPCGLCAELGHEMWTCPQKSVCFNCGLPGHVVRDCNQRRGMPERCVCTICYRSGHHRFDCRENPWNASMQQDAICMQCGQRGHFMCSEMRWFFGLKGLTCFNCGMKGHRGIQCRRPDVDVCQKNPDIAQNEIDMAGTISL